MQQHECISKALCCIRETRHKASILRGSMYIIIHSTKGTTVGIENRPVVIGAQNVERGLTVGNL